MYHVEFVITIDSKGKKEVSSGQANQDIPDFVKNSQCEPLDYQVGSVIL